MTGISNSSTYQPILLSHQTNLSTLISSSNIFYNIGSPISIPKNGIIKISIVGYVSSGTGYIGLNLIRGSLTYSATQSTTSLLNTYGYSGIQNNVSLLSSNIYAIFLIEIPVLANDSIQIVVTNNTANTSVFINDMVVILQ